MLEHVQKVEFLQNQIQAHSLNQSPLNLTYQKGHSNTTRSKTYKSNGISLNCGNLDQIIHIDTHSKRVLVEPRVTMESLIKATLSHGLIPPVVPVFKGITVGGAIMGAAAESSSHLWGIFHDTCTSVEFLNGKGEKVLASPSLHPELFYGMSGSYGALGLLVAAEIQLIPIQSTVNLTYRVYHNPLDALQRMQSQVGQIEFLDGIVFSKDLAVIIEGKMSSAQANPLSSEWYAQHVQKCAQKETHFEQNMPLYEYLFRYDRGAFWMGTFLFKLPFLYRYIKEGLFKQNQIQSWFTEKEVQLFKTLSYPNSFLQKCTRSLVQSQKLWSLFHKAESWVQDRLIVQDFCIPTNQAASFLTTALQSPGTFPIWLCPIKGTQTPQLFAPHQHHENLINIGIYGCPSYAAPMKKIIRPLEEKTAELGGRKVLYSRSYYTETRFWEIYNQKGYEALRDATSSKGVWHDVTEKVLSS